MTELKRRGVEFEEVDIPGLETTDGIAEVEGNYPSKGGKGERAAWFRDCEGTCSGSGSRSVGQAATGSGAPPCAGTFTPERSSAPVTIAPAAKIAAAHQKAVT